MKDAATALPVEEIDGLCKERGLQIDGVRRRGTVLVLEPSADSPLPRASELAGLAEVIDVEGIRYVTLGLEGFAVGGGRDE